MSTERILSIIFGVLMIIGGAFCLMNPGISYSLLLWIIIVAMLASSITGIMTWSARKKAGIASSWDLAASIISLVFAVILIASFAMRITALVMLLYLVMAWMIFTGIVRIIQAFNMRSMLQSGDPAGGNWGGVMCFGILMVIAGMFGFTEPLLAAITIGIVIGVNLVIHGIELLFISSAAA